MYKEQLTNSINSIRTLTVTKGRIDISLSRTSIKCIYISLGISPKGLLNIS